MLQFTPGLPFLHVPGPSPPGMGDWFVVVYAAPLTAQAGRTPLSAMANRIAVASSGRSTSARTRGSPVLIILLCPFSSAGSAVTLVQTATRGQSARDFRLVVLRFQ